MFIVLFRSVQAFTKPKIISTLVIKSSKNNQYVSFNEKRDKQNSFDIYFYILACRYIFGILFILVILFVTFLTIFGKKCRKAYIGTT